MHDGRHDLWIEFADDRVPVNPNGDAVGAVVRRTPEELVVTVRYADIERHANKTWGVEIDLDIPGDNLGREVDWSEYRYSDTHRWDREASYVKYSSEDPVTETCRGLRGEPDFRAETVTVWIPGRCYSNAPWVVVSGLSAQSSSSSQAAVDYVGTDGPKPAPTPRLVVPVRSGSG
jgi:hypothetical protein